MRPFLYGLTFIAGLCLFPATAQAGPWGSPESTGPTKAEKAAAEKAEETGVYFVGCIAAIVGLLVVVQFLREVRGTAPAPRVIVYHAAGGHSYDGTGRSHDGSGDSRDEYPSRDVSDF
jgi:hypothetical protein